MLILFVMIMLIVIYYIATSMYKSKFNRRYQTTIEDRFDITKFEGLARERFVFKSNKGQKLVGYLYDNVSRLEHNGVVIFAHGFGGGGQNGYMDIFDVLTRHGYFVFAYDATANDESEGEFVGGLPQGIIDLDYAVTFAKGIEKIRKLPYFLMGYSWGGLSVANVLNYQPDVKGVVSLAGWNKSFDIIVDRVKKKTGRVGLVMSPFVLVHELLSYGKYALKSAVSGFEKSECRVMIIHSSDDTVVPFKYGYETYYKEFSDNPRFVFKKYDDRGHGVYKNTDGSLDTSLIEEIVHFFDSSVD